MEIVFLGTGSMVPTKERNPSSIFTCLGSEGILVDCAEGTQRQMKLAGIKLTRVTKILITHWHGDHVLGLAGLIQSLGSLEYEKRLFIYGPPGTVNYIKNLKKAFIFDRSIEMEVTDVESGRFFENDEMYFEAYPLSHGVPSLGFSVCEKDKLRIDIAKAKKFGVPEGPHLGAVQAGKDIIWNGKKVKAEDISYVDKGKKIAFVLDTVLCNNCYKAAKDADVLISEATYTSKLEGKAREHRHMTAKQAALVANRANAKLLVLTHFSGRYKNTQEAEEDARSCFDNVVCAKDLMKLDV